MIRFANPSDISAITEIYNDAILNATATFDTEIKSTEDMLKWLNNHNEKFCVMVAEINEEVVAWASLSQYSDRCAYDQTAEFSVYVHPKHRRKGLSKLITEAVLNQGKSKGVKAVISRITEGNEISVKIHEKFQFFTVGILKQVGVKFGKTLDVLIMQKLL